MVDHGYLRTKDNEKIAFIHYRHFPFAGEVVVIAHGFFSSKDAFLFQDLAEKSFRGKDVLLFDFRGHGESSGIYTWSAREEKDLYAVLEHISPIYDRISLVGFSLGASICINMLAKDLFNIDRLLCISAVADPSRIDWRPWRVDWDNDILYSLFSRSGRQGRGARMGPWWLEKPVPRDNVQRLKVPVMYVHGEKDKVVGAYHSKELFGKTNAEKELYLAKDGPHAEYLLRQDPVATEKIVDWIRN